LPDKFAPTNTTGVGDVDAAFSAALAADAGVTPPVIPAPPRRAVVIDPDAPHGREADGSPIAPYGFKNGTNIPRKTIPGRTKDDLRAEAPRVAPAAVKSIGKPRDYSADLAGLGMSVWMGGVALPPTRPYAHVFKQAMPGMVHAWNEAAQQNAQVRRQVERLAGDGSYAWVLGVALSTAPLIAGCLELAKSGKTPEDKAQRKEIRRQYGEAAQAELREYVEAQVGDLQAEAA